MVIQHVLERCDLGISGKTRQLLWHCLLVLGLLTAACGKKSDTGNFPPAEIRKS